MWELRAATIGAAPDDLCQHNSPKRGKTLDAFWHWPLGAASLHTGKHRLMLTYWQPSADVQLSFGQRLRHFMYQHRGVSAIRWVIAFNVITNNTSYPGGCTQQHHLIFMQEQSSWRRERCSIFHKPLSSVHACCHVSRSLSILKRPRWRSAVWVYCNVKHEHRHISLNKTNAVSAAVGIRASASLWKPTR